MDIEQNKQNAIAFLDVAFAGDPAKAVELYVGEDYKQHNPAVADGKAGFIEYFSKMAVDYPKKSIEVVRAVGEGDLVALHTHQIWPEDGDEYVTMDFFRFDDLGKIIEHWDAVQLIPDSTANGNPMY
ncbi:MAG: hypothetical protein CMN28_16100 [Salinisphaeraceae bacterium]|nr:hypothetical protein [Salinisphaeraceae bacterium]